MMAVRKKPFLLKKRNYLTSPLVNVLSVLGVALAWHGAGLRSLLLALAGVPGVERLPGGGNFLFCQKRKLPPAGKALTLQTKEESAKPKAINRKSSDQIGNVRSYKNTGFCRARTDIGWMLSASAQRFSPTALPVLA